MVQIQIVQIETVQMEAVLNSIKYQNKINRFKTNINAFTCSVNYEFLTEDKL